jgi:hypothetical protein
MRLTSTGLGIGTSSPLSKLTVAQSADGFDQGFTLTRAGANRGTIFLNASNDTLNFGRSTSTSMTLDSSGNLGLGVTPSAWRTAFETRAIQVGPVGSIFSLSASEANNYTGFKYNNYQQNDGTNIYLKSNFATEYRQANGAHEWLNAPSGTAGNAITFTQAMTLDASGNLGVGTTSPSSYGVIVAKRDQTSDTAITVSNAGTTNAATTMSFVLNEGEVARGWLRRYRDGSGNTEIGFSDSLLFTGNVTASKTERMRLNSSGVLFVGATAITSDANYFAYDPGNAFSDFGHVTGVASSVPYIRFLYGGTVIGSITQLGTTAVQYNVSSDQRLKENIQNAEPASDLIDAIQVRQFDWKSDGSHQRYGFVAQELVSIAPEAVHQPADPDEMMAVDYSKLVPMLVKEIQSLRIRIAQLENKL